jgi:hypothetical protein
MSKKEPKEPVTWNGFNYMEITPTYLGDEVRVHPFLPYGLDKIVIEGYVVELGTTIEKIVTQDDPLAISPEVELEVKTLTEADIKQNGKLTKAVADQIDKIVKAERKRLYGRAISPTGLPEVNELTVPRGKGSTRKVDIKFSTPVKAYKYSPIVEEEVEPG